ncbi:hypothetical protein P8452_65347 [Trifolium repens]|nr:hypothetical protein P8452_65347 [Trifolium repens]
MVVVRFRVSSQSISDSAVCSLHYKMESQIKHALVVKVMGRTGSRGQVTQDLLEKEIGSPYLSPREKQDVSDRRVTLNGLVIKPCWFCDRL